MDFEWDEAKSQANLAKHGIPLDLVPLAFEGPILARRNDRHGEERWIAIGLIEGLAVAFAYMKRGDRIRIITARRANRYERETYVALARAHGR
jgi:uncharacterized DUF497 family protein